MRATRVKIAGRIGGIKPAMHTGQSGDESGSTWLSRNGWWIRFLCHVAITFAAYRIFLVSGPLSDTGFIPRSMLPFLLFTSGIFWLMLLRYYNCLILRPSQWSKIRLLFIGIGGFRRWLYLGYAYCLFLRILES